MIPRAFWATADDGGIAMYWAIGDAVDVDLSDLIPPAPAVSRVHTAPIDEAALDVLLQRSRLP